MLNALCSFAWGTRPEAMFRCRLRRSAVKPSEAVDTLYASVGGERLLGVLDAYDGVGALSEASPSKVGA